MKRINKTIGIALFSIVLLFSNGCISNQEIPRQTDNYKTIIDFQYDSITISPKENFIVVEQDGRFGAYVKANETWKLKIPVQYARIFCHPSEDRVLAAYLDDSHIDLYRPDGSRLLDQTIRSVLLKENGGGMMVSVDNIHVGYLSWTGEWILEPQFTKSILPMDDGSYLVNTESKTSGDWIDEEGISLLPADKNITGVLESSALPCIGVRVKDNGTYYGVIGTDGKYILSPVYSDVFLKKDSTGELYLIPYEKLSNTAYIYRPNGEKVFKEGYPYITPVGEALFGVKKNEKFGVVNEKGEFVIPPIHDFVVSNGQFIIVEDTGELVAQRKQADAYWIYDMAGRQVSDIAYDKVSVLEAAPFLAAVTKGQKTGFLSADSSVSIPMFYEDYCFDYSKDKNTLLVKKGGKWGGVNLQNKVIVDFLYSEATYCGNNSIYAVRDGKCGIIALDGETELPFVFEPPGSGEELVASEHMAVVWKNGKCGCVEMIR